MLSVKKERVKHFLRILVVIQGIVIYLYFGKGRQHDFKLFQSSGVRLHSDTQSLQDKGYQDIQNLHDKSRLPIKKPKGGKLNREQKAQNRELARERIGIEHVNRHFKIFRILGQRYRNRRQRYGLRCN
jgi:DDE superfamily endonuclease